MIAARSLGSPRHRAAMTTAAGGRGGAPSQSGGESRRRRAPSSSGPRFSAEAKTTIPKPQLNVRSISVWLNAADLGEPAENSRRREGGEVQFDSRSSGSTRGRLSGKPPPVIWASARKPGAPSGRRAAASRRAGSGSAALRARCAPGGTAPAVPGEAGALDNAAHQRKAVGMHARRRQADHDVARLQPPRGNSFPRSAAPTAKPARSKSPLA